VPVEFVFEVPKRFAPDARALWRGLANDKGRATKERARFRLLMDRLGDAVPISAHRIGEASYSACEVHYAIGNQSADVEMLRLSLEVCRDAELAEWFTEDRAAFREWATEALKALDEFARLSVVDHLAEIDP